MRRGCNRFYYRPDFYIRLGRNNFFSSSLFFFNCSSKKNAFFMSFFLTLMLLALGISKLHLKRKTVFLCQTDIKKSRIRETKNLSLADSRTNTILERLRDLSKKKKKKKEKEKK